MPVWVLREPQFQSTPSGGKATKSEPRWKRKERVSIHAFRGEGDWTCARQGLSLSMFQSTPSGGKATAISRAAVPCSRQIL